MCAFDSLEGAVNTVIQTIQSGIPVARIELLDDAQIDAVNKYSKLSSPVKTTLFLEFHGTEAGAQEQAEMVQAIAAEHGGGDFDWTGAGRGAHQAVAGAPRRRLRHQGAAQPGWGMWATDVCVPISRLAECISRDPEGHVASDLLIAPIVGHVGDGNFHLTLMVDPDDPKEMRARRAAQRPPGDARAGDGRHLHRRARHRHAAR